MNRPGITAIYAFEMARARRTLWQSLVAPVITTSLYFLVFGTAIGNRMTAMDGEGKGFPRWNVELLRCKGLRPPPGGNADRREWTLEFDHRARRVVCVPPALADRPAAPARRAV